MCTLRTLLIPLCSKLTTTFIRNYNVAVVGGANSVGQTLSLMLRNEPSITNLALYDTDATTPGIVLDLSHIPSESIIKGYTENSLENALKGADIIIATGGNTLRPGLAKKALLTSNTDFIKQIGGKIGRIHPMPFVGIVTEPINSTIPILAEIIKSHGNYDARKLFGITGVDAMRAQTLYAAEQNAFVNDCFVPIIGGHSEKTMIPLLSQARPQATCEVNDGAVQAFAAKIRRADDIVTEALRGWAPTLSTAYSALLFTRGILKALDGMPTTVNAFVENNDFGTSFFAGLVTVDSQGIVDMCRFTDLSQYECKLLEHSISQLRKDVWLGRKILETA